MNYTVKNLVKKIEDFGIRKCGFEIIDDSEDKPNEANVLKLDIGKAVNISIGVRFFHLMILFALRSKAI